MQTEQWTLVLIIAGGGLGGLILLELLWNTMKLGIGPTPSGPAARALISTLCAQQIEQRQGRSVGREVKPLHIFELGSGWGGLGLHLARSMPIEVQVKSVELSLTPLLISRLLLRINAWVAPRLMLTDRLSYERADLIGVIDQLRGGEILVCYLCAQQMRRLAQGFARHPLPPNITLISLVFALPDTAVMSSFKVGNLYQDRIRVYQLS